MTGSRLGLVVLLALPFGFRPGATAPGAKPDAPAAQAGAEEPDAFAATVRPVLREHCAPCHEPGGKMYDTLPFDKAATIASHRDGILKRLKGDDRAAVEKWLAGLPPAE